MNGGADCPVLLVWWFSRSRASTGWQHSSGWHRLVAFAVFQFAVGALMTFPAATEQLRLYSRCAGCIFSIFFSFNGGWPDWAISAPRKALAMDDPLSPWRHDVRCAARLVQKQRSHRMAGEGNEKSLGRAFLWTRVERPKGCGISPSIPSTWGFHAEDNDGMRA